MIKAGMIWVSLALFYVQGFAQEHQDHQDHLDEHEEGIVVLEPEQLETLDLGVITVQHGKLTDTLRFPAEIEFDPMRVAHLTPRVEGITKEVNFRLGDSVKKRDVLAILESRELGKAKSDYMAQLAREALHQKTFEREKRLWEKRISAEQDFLVAEQILAETRIAVRQAREVLLSLGVSNEILTTLPNESELVLNRYNMTMPFDGKIIEQHISLGEVLTTQRTAFIVADTSHVWVMARVTERDLSAVKTGQEALATFKGLPGRTFPGEVDFISSQIERDSRTAQIRLVLENPQEMLRAGMFGQVVVQVPSKKETNAFLVPKNALQRVQDGYVAFRQLEPGRYEMVSVNVLTESNDFAEVTGDLQPGDQLVTGDTFILKSHANKEELVGDHDH